MIDAVHDDDGHLVGFAKVTRDCTEQRRALQAATPDVAKVRKAVDDEVKPKMEEFKKKGGFVHELTAAQRAEWRKLVQPNQEALIKDMGPMAPELWAAIQKGKAEYAASGGK